MHYFFTFIVLLLLSFNTSFACHGGSKPSRYKQILDDKSGLYTALGNKLHAGQVMHPNSYLLSSNKMYLGLMQSDGKFIIYSNSNDAIKFSTYTSGTDSKLSLQPDGNVVLSSVSNKPLWSSGRFRNNMCYDQRCILFLENDGNLSAYKGNIEPPSKYWSTASPSINDEEFNKISGRIDPETCPITEHVKMTTFNWQEKAHSVPRNPQKDPIHDEFLLRVPHDDLLVRFFQLRKRDEQENGRNDNNIFSDYASQNPSWSVTFGDFMIPPGELELYTSDVTRDPQRIYYMRLAVANHNPVARYVATIIQPYHINTGQRTTQASRDYTNELATASRLDQGSNRNAYESLDAGHILPFQLGGPVETWNLFPQNGQINRFVWSQIESDVRHRAEVNFLAVVAEYWLEYSNAFPTVPTYLHYSFRFFNPIRNNEHVHTITGIIPNHIPDGVRRMTQTLAITYPDSENSEERLVTYEPNTINVPNFQAGLGFLVDVFNRANRQCNRNRERRPGPG